MAAAEATHLSWSALSTVLVAMFAITVGYGVALPILPFLIEQIAGKSTPQALSWHTGLLTGAYIIAIFVGAPVWGRISDRCGRKPIILVGLLGFAATTAFFAVTESLPLLYLGRFLAGLFAHRRSGAFERVARLSLRANQYRRHRRFLHRAFTRCAGGACCWQTLGPPA